MRDENFNCTIQELKHEKLGSYGVRQVYFNCTIQELKHALGCIGAVVVLLISIAPYRN